MLEPYITTFKGGRIYPLGPRATDFRTSDIAHSLSQICRYNGHTSEFWSVAAHSLEVSKVLEEMGRPLIEQFAGLMHDACESCLCDIPRPIKPLVVGYSQWEETVDFVIARKFGYPYPFP
jgi:5'-deoxynucleotidase YfbR-like HD superfamily hydrolase